MILQRPKRAPERVYRWREERQASDGSAKPDSLQRIGNFIDPAGKLKHWSDQNALTVLNLPLYSTMQQVLTIPSLKHGKGSIDELQRENRSFRAGAAA
jgi:hypothetical protein